jgi:DNA-directed RNA polymerase subunit RPC12/RpoP
MSKGPSKSFTCPHCSKRFQWTTQIADRKAQCPACAKRIRIPTVPGRVAEAVDPLPESHKPDPSEESDTYALDLTGVDETIVEPPPTPAMQAAAQTGRCPACNQSIKPDAIICIKCGYNLKKGKRMQTAVADPGAAEPARGKKAPSGGMPSIGASPIASALEAREDEAAANKFIDLWLPLGLILIGLAFQIITQLYFSDDPASGLIAAGISVGVELAIRIPLLLAAMIIAVKLLDVAFGPLGQALLKLTAVVLGPTAIGLTIAFLIGGIVGLFVGMFIAFVIYWTLLTVLFNLEGIEALYLIFIIWGLEWLISLVMTVIAF